MTTDVENTEPTATGEICAEKCSIFDKKLPLRTFSGDGWSKWDESIGFGWFNYKAYNCIFGFFSSFSVNGWFALFSVNCLWGIFAVNSVFSILSVNSTFSIMSVNSLFAIGCDSGSFKV